jgi:tubulin polyglutamylase TTLL6/13
MGHSSRAWILKPDSMSQGKGIIITKMWSKVTSVENEAYVAQKYIGSPMLIDGLKFDLRLYVLVSGVDPLRVYLF